MKLPLTPSLFQSADVPALKRFLSARGEGTPPNYWLAGKSPVGTFQAVLDSPPPHHQLWHDPAGEVHALTWLCPEPPSTVDGEAKAWRVLAHPEHRKVPAIDAYIEHAESGLAALYGGQRSGINTAAYSLDTPLTNRLIANGYTKGHALDVLMLCPLNRNIAVPPTPAGMDLREFAPGTPGEIAQRAGAQSDAFAGVPEANAWSIENVHRFMRWAEGRADHHLVLAINNAEQAGRIVSFGLFVTDMVARVGELDPIGTRATYQRRGLSKLVLLHGLSRLREAGMQSAVVRTGTDNLAAIQTYRSVGFTVVDQLYSYSRGDVP